jgi:polyhydroxyalkanoate synthesis regulator phasin
MDAESLAQIEQIVTTAVSGSEGRLRQEFGENIETLGISVRQELAEKFEEAERHSGVLHEDVLRRIDLVIEGHQGLREGLQALREQVRDLDAKIEHESLETRALIQLSYRQLQDRVETLEQRVQIIEKRLGLSA